MKLIRSCICAFLLLSYLVLPCYADVTGSVTKANVRLSLVSTAPFVDFSASGTLTPYINWRVILTDSAGKTAQARILSAGTGEALGEALNVSNCENHPTAGFDTFDGVSATGFHAIQSTAGSKYAGTAAGSISFTAGQLFKTTFTLTGDNVNIVPRTAFASAMIGVGMTATAGSITHRSVITQTTTGIWSFYSLSNREFTISNLAVQQQLSPSSTGVVTSAWTIESGFNYNDNYTYKIEQLSNMGSIGYTFQLGLHGE